MLRNNEVLNREFITTPLRILSQVYQFGCELGDDAFMARVEIFQELGNERRFFFQVWRTDFIDSTPTFGNDSGLATFQIQHEWSPFLGISSHDMEKGWASQEEAFSGFLERLDAYFAKCSGSEDTE